MAVPLNADRFRILVVPHLRAAWNLARWLTRNDSDAEDVLQEASLRAYRFLDGFRGESARAWFLSIVRNTAFTWMERNRDQPLPDEAAAANDMPHAEAADAGLARAERRREVNAALRRLPTEFREVVVLREMEELSYREIAQVAAIPIGTVMSRLSRARRLLADYLAEPTKEHCNAPRD